MKRSESYNVKVKGSKGKRAAKLKKKTGKHSTNVLKQSHEDVKLVKDPDLEPVISGVSFDKLTDYLNTLFQETIDRKISAWAPNQDDQSQSLIDLCTLHEYYTCSVIREWNVLMDAWEQKKHLQTDHVIQVHQIITDLINPDLQSSIPPEPNCAKKEPNYGVTSVGPIGHKIETMSHESIKPLSKWDTLYMNHEFESLKSSPVDSYIDSSINMLRYQGFQRVEDFSTSTKVLFPHIDPEYRCTSNFTNIETSGKKRESKTMAGSSVGMKINTLWPNIDKVSVDVIYNNEELPKEVYPLTDSKLRTLWSKTDTEYTIASISTNIDGFNESYQPEIGTHSSTGTKENIMWPNIGTEIQSASIASYIDQLQKARELKRMEYPPIDSKFNTMWSSIDTECPIISSSTNIDPVKKTYQPESGTHSPMVTKGDIVWPNIGMQRQSASIDSNIYALRKKTQGPQQMEFPPIDPKCNTMWSSIGVNRRDASVNTDIDAVYITQQLGGAEHSLNSLWPSIDSGRQTASSSTNIDVSKTHHLGMNNVWPNIDKERQILSIDRRIDTLKKNNEFDGEEYPPISLGTNLDAFHKAHQPGIAEKLSNVWPNIDKERLISSIDSRIDALMKNNEFQREEYPPIGTNFDTINKIPQPGINVWPNIDKQRQISSIDSRIDALMKNNEFQREDYPPIGTNFDTINKIPQPVINVWPNIDKERQIPSIDNRIESLKKNNELQREEYPPIGTNIDTFNKTHQSEINAKLNNVWPNIDKERLNASAEYRIEAPKKNKEFQRETFPPIDTKMTTLWSNIVTDGQSSSIDNDSLNKIQQLDNTIVWPNIDIKPQSETINKTLKSGIAPKLKIVWPNIGAELRNASTESNIDDPNKNLEPPRKELPDTKINTLWSTIVSERRSTPISTNKDASEKPQRASIETNIDKKSELKSLAQSPIGTKSNKNNVPDDPSTATNPWFKNATHEPPPPPTSHESHCETPPAIDTLYMNNDYKDDSEFDTCSEASQKIQKVDAFRKDFRLKSYADVSKENSEIVRKGCWDAEVDRVRKYVAIQYEKFGEMFVPKFSKVHMPCCQDGYFSQMEIGMDWRGNPIAVKYLKPTSKVTNEKAAARIRQLEHKYLLTSYLSPGPTTILATPLMDFNLGQFVMHLSTMGQLHKEAFRIARQIAEGVEALHAQPRPIVHGNLKPTNVLIDSSANVKIAEFGQSMEEDMRSSTSSLIWKCWEELRAELNGRYQEKTTEGDVVSTGMLLHFVMSGGKHPFGSEVQEILNNIRNGTCELTVSNANLRDLLTAMLAANPLSRPTMEEVLRHIFWWPKSTQWEMVEACSEAGPSPESRELRAHVATQVATFSANRDQAILSSKGGTEDVREDLKKWLHHVENNDSSTTAAECKKISRNLPLYLYKVLAACSSIPLVRRFFYPPEKDPKPNS